MTTAVLAGLTGVAGMAGVANAVNVNPDGLGQVLLFPYYTARGGNDTLISIVNTTERGKAVKIRFIEALNSREVLDFNIYMSPFDVWTAAVTATDEGGAKMITGDTTCTVPYIFGDFGGEQEFLDFEYVTIPGTIGGKADGGPSGIERTASGYIEVIEMGTLLEEPDEAPEAGDANFGQIIPWAVKHVAPGVPRNCDLLVDAWTDFGSPAANLPWIAGDTEFGFDTQQGASGGLFGSASIISVDSGTMFSYNATTVDGFWAPGSTAHTRPDSLIPSLASGNADTSFVFDNGNLVEHTWDFPLLALNATLTLDRLVNEYVTDEDISARTEWVLTFPTKRFHVDALTQDGVEPEEPIPPFTRTWHLDEDDELVYACEDLSFRFYDREEAPYPTDAPPPEETPPIVSPRPPTPETTPDDPILFQLCREANVIRFGDSEEETLPGATEILGEPARDQVQLGFTNFALPFSEGWVNFDLTSVDANSPVFDDVPRRISLEADNGDVIEGLPVVGFAVTTYTNGNLAGGVLANYGGTFNHRGSRSVVSD
ncbi:MAG: hypothetical protein V2J42_12210 [Wenzhouxiangella sp.]|nr:hypothetical protein [Wenzhouxiangella sp.]